MENFEYSIQLNDRDWAEFYLTSEECSLTPPSLATTDDQILSDLEDGEPEEGRSIQVRVGPGPIHHIVSCPTQGLPDGHLPVEDVLSGSEEETDLGSVSRFLCSNDKLGVASTQPPWNQEGQLPPVTLGPPGSQRGLAGAHGEREVTLATKRGEPEREQQLIKPACSLPPKVAASAVQQEGWQDQTPDQEALKQPCAEHDHLDPSDPLESPERERQSRPSCLELSETVEGLPQTSSAETQPLPPWMDNTASARDPESLGSTRPPGWAPSLVLKRPDPADGLEGKAKELPSALQASQFQEDKAPPGSGLALQDSRSKKHGERPPKGAGKGDEVAADPKGERQACRRKEPSRGNPKEEGPFGQEKRPSQSSGLEQASRGRTGPRSTQTAEMEGEGMSGTRGQTLLGTGVPPGEDCPPRVQGDHGSESFKESLPYSPAPEDAPESKLTSMTWPEMYDSFFCDDAQGTETRKDNLGADPNQGPPQTEGPEMYEYFFPEMDRAQGGRSHGVEGARAVDDGFLSSGGPEDTDFGATEGEADFSVPEVYEHFFVYSTKDQRNWRGFLLSMPASEARKAIGAVKALLRRSARFFKSRPVSHGALLQRSSQGKLVLLAPRLIDESHPGPEELGMALMQPERPLKPVFTHRDMCLGFVAFASWAVKTSDLQAPDAWKIVLLANFGTLSAIRFFRRNVVMEGHHES